MNEEQIYLYIDFTNDNIPFYVGVGLQSRIDNYKKCARNNKHWIISKKYGCNRQSFEMKNREEASMFEKKLIKVLKTNYKIHSNNEYAANGSNGGEIVGKEQLTNMRKSKDTKEKSYVKKYIEKISKFGKNILINYIKCTKQLD